MITSSFHTSPRQRMINLMYLVLIALLALDEPYHSVEKHDSIDAVIQQMSGEIEEKNRIIEELSEGCLLNSELHAYVMPEAPYFSSGENFRGEILLVLKDTSFIHRIVIQEPYKQTLKDMHIELPGRVPGEHSLKGYVEVSPDKINSRLIPFESRYTVTEPVATISPVLVNILYAGYPNRLHIAVPGIPTEALKVNSPQGEIKKLDLNYWEVTPFSPGDEFPITVSYFWNGKYKEENITFRVLPLPEPVFFIEGINKSNYYSYKGGAIKRQNLLQENQFIARYEDHLLDVRFDILSFELVWFDSFGNRLSERTQGSQFSERQKEVIKSFAGGKTFYISRVQAKGPDGLVRELPGIEIILN